MSTHCGHQSPIVALDDITLTVRSLNGIYMGTAYAYMHGKICPIVLSIYGFHHFRPIHPLSFILILFHQFSPTFIHFCPFHPFSPIFFHFDPFSSIFIFYPLSSTLIPFHPFSSTFIHFLSTFIQFHPKLISFCCKIVCV